MIPRKTFVFYLQDTPTGKCYYLDSNRNIQTININTASFDCSLQNAPSGWLEIELGFIRNTKYYGLNRSFATPFEFVKDSAYMIRTLFIGGVGTEVPLTLSIFKYNDQPVTGEPTYELYYKGQVDLPKIDDVIAEGVKVNLIEGGVMQLLKAYENTVLEIPCDGSIEENIKVNLDGLLVPDTVFFSIPNLKLGADGVGGQWTIPLVKIQETGDSFGAIIGEPSLEEAVTGYFQNSANSALYFNLPTTVRIRGTVVIRAIENSGAGHVPVQLFTATSKTTVYGFALDYTQNLIPQIPDTYPIPSGGTHPAQAFLLAQNDYRFNFDVTVPLDAYEKLFFVVGGFAPSKAEIISGEIQTSFQTQFVATRASGMTAWDLFRLIVKNICQLASTTSQTFNYEAKSDLLQSKLNFFITCGDALRASGDPNYQRFYHFSPSQDFIFYGPVLKTSLSDFFASISAMLCAALGNEQGWDETEKLFIEALEYVYNASQTTFELGEISNLKWKFKEEFSDFLIGTPPQTYDQKAGKYEYNTTLEMKAPVKTFTKKLDKISKYRTDSYGIEKLRSNLGNTATSTTRNDSDNAVFLINTNRDSWIYDFFKVYFNSLVPDPDNTLNTNTKFTAGIYAQPLQLPLSDGEYFRPNLDNAIFVFSETGYVATESGTLVINGIINRVNAPAGAPTDSITFKFWKNGSVIFEQTIDVAGINTPVTISHSFSETFAAGYGIYITASTTPYCEATLDDVTLTIGSYLTASGTFIPVEQGTSLKCLSLPVVTPNSIPYVPGTSHAQYGYQYFVFNTITANTTFTVKASVKGYIEGIGDATVGFYLNGLRIADFISILGSAGRTAFDISLNFFLPYTFNLGDVIWAGVDVAAGVTLQFTYFNWQFDSTYIKCFSLKRVQYDSLSGIPSLAKNELGIVRTDIAGAPYNIEEFTPKRMYNRWKRFIKSCFLDSVNGPMTFQTLSKNQFLSTSYLGETITENSDEDILDVDRFFYPIEIEFRTKVPETFAKLLTGVANAHIHATYYGYDIWFFADSLKQKPALNESQSWTGTLSPLTDLSILANIETDGLKLITMGANSIYCPAISSVQFVPEGQILPSKYHTYNRNEFWFREQISSWINQNNYWQPVQIEDVIPLQFITRGLDPVKYKVFKCSGEEYIGETNLDTITSPAISDPYVLWQKQIDTSDWPEGAYYIEITAGVGDLAAKLISEGFDVRTNWPETCYFEYTCSRNSQTMIFDTGFTGRMRVKAQFDNVFKQKYAGKFYIDQPQDITILSAIPYEITKLWVGSDDGVPDYVHKKVARILLLDGCNIEGEGFSLNEGADWEEVFIEGNPKKYYKIDIRPAKNDFGIAVNAEGADLDTSIIATFDAKAFGPNANNASGTTDPDIIDVELNN